MIQLKNRYILLALIYNGLVNTSYDLLKISKYGQYATMAIKL